MTLLQGNFSFLGHSWIFIVVTIHLKLVLWYFYILEKWRVCERQHLIGLEHLYKDFLKDVTNMPISGFPSFPWIFGQKGKLVFLLKYWTPSGRAISQRVTKKERGYDEFNKFLLNWSIVDLLWCISFRCIAKWFSFIYIGFPGGSDGKDPVCNVGDLGLLPELGRSSGGGYSSPLQYSCLSCAWESAGNLVKMQILIQDV